MANEPDFKSLWASMEHLMAGADALLARVRGLVSSEAKTVRGGRKRKRKVARRRGATAVAKAGGEPVS